MVIIKFNQQYSQEIYDFVMKIKADELGWKLDATDLHDVDKNYITNGGNFWIAIENSEISGTIALKNMGNQQGYLKRMYVAKEFRGTGVADQLLTTLLAFAKENNLKEIYLATTKSPESERAIAFYGKKGFNKIDTLPPNFIDGANFFMKLGI